MIILPDIIETTPSQVTKRQGGAVWLISTEDGLITLYKEHSFRYIPVTVFVKSEGQIRTAVLYMHPEAGYTTSEF